MKSDAMLVRFVHTSRPICECLLRRLRSIPVESVCTFSGSHTGDLEIQYEQGDVVYSSLSGESCETDVQLSETELKFLPAYIDRISQATCRYVYDCMAHCMLVSDALM